MARILLLALVCASPAIAAANRCNVSEQSLSGYWERSGNEGFFEQMKFGVEGMHNVFKSWLHNRPEIFDATWSLKDCVLHITRPRDPLLSFTFAVSAKDRQLIELREQGQPVARYHRVEDTP